MDIPGDGTGFVTNKGTVTIAVNAKVVLLRIWKQ